MSVFVNSDYSANRLCLGLALSLSTHFVYRCPSNLSTTPNSLHNYWSHSAAFKLWRGRVTMLGCREIPYRHNGSARIRLKPFENPRQRFNCLCAVRHFSSISSLGWIAWSRPLDMWGCLSIFWERLNVGSGEIIPAGSPPPGNRDVIPFNSC